MSENIAKSGYIPVASGSRSTMLWNNNVLPLMKLYIYLGFLHTANSIKVAEVATASSNKVSSLLSMLSGVAHIWSPLVHTTVYCTFFRSQMDYSLSLLYFVNKFAKTPATTAVFLRLKKVHTQAMLWCTNIAGHSLITSAITAIATPANQAFNLATCFAIHIENLSFDNPLRLLLPTCNRIVSFEQPRRPPCLQVLQSLAQRIDSAKLLAKISTLPLVNGTPNMLMDRIHAFHVHQYTKPNNSCLFITTDAHTPHEIYCSSNPSPDCLLCIQDRDQIHLALSWRCNTFGFQFNCTCSEHFSQSHIQTYSLLEDFPVNLSQHWTVLAQDFVKHTSLVDTNYSIMNSLLNHTKHDLFDQTLMFLLTKLVNCPKEDWFPAVNLCHLMSPPTQSLKP
ncbi:hypothetical protein DSO57_1027546 [Entomophthora muscae]|uniref:Uncharacterized protein n=1 Tax=Entomophthora muscae TaxID=34485 RepID=A0ACC2RSV3_9FUNG|nr:hypothetical protein DSO57_1027546 [Entomophthora muscae]